MPRIFRDKLVRGVKLCVQHITRATAAIRSMLTTAGVERGNISRAHGRTRLVFQVPSMSTAFFTNADPDRNDIALTIPFPLPPFQEHWSSTGQTDEDTPIPIVDEVHISFDQKREPAAIVDDGANDGDLSYIEVKQYEIRLTLAEKTQRYTGFGGTAAPYSPERTIFTMPISASAYSGRTLRFNPFAATGINRQLSPFKTYCLQIVMPRVTGAVASVFLPSFTVTLVLRSPLGKRDALSLTGTTPQNIPIYATGSSEGSKTPDAIVPPVFIGGDKIEEDDVHLEMYQLDQKLVTGLEGGYRRESVPPPVEHLADDSCYEIIAVPLWGNWSDVRPADADRLPYLFTGAPYDDPTQDRRLIPIVHPWTLHHVIAVANYFAEDGLGVLPTSVTFEQQVAVGLVSGQRGDLMKYQRIAHGRWTPAGGAFPRANLLVDEIKALDGGMSVNVYDYEMMSIPLEGAGGEGYYAQGAPVFIGKGTDASRTRTNIAGAASATQGCETLLEVRWQIQDSVGLSTTAAIPPGGSVTDEDIIIGTHGHWVFLVGKKSIVGHVADLPI
jgi:hypothetical protein